VKPVEPSKLMIPRRKTLSSAAAEVNGLTTRTNDKRERRKNLLFIALEKIPSEETPEGIVKEKM
jgi:hypothetical protein